MVQRKVAKKLGIQAESSKSHVASEKPCSQHQDSRNKGGGEMKKKMKKSRSFKASELPQRRDQSRFKKLSVDVSKVAAPQKKTSPVKLSDGSPNYMKPTSCSDARKERLHLQVSPQSQTTDENKGLRNSNRSKPSLASGIKPIKVLKRRSSLKPVRPSMKKSYGVASHSNRATCSSTLKDSKFPAYVDLHPGGTESEGTSVMKVCPYTYCSLNGHHHAPSPPLKRFLSARRRFLKTQKSMKWKGLSSPRHRNKEIDTRQMGFDGDPAILESDSTGSATFPVMEEIYNDFFVEIFVKPRGEIAESVNYSDARRFYNRDDEPKLDFAETPEVLVEASSDGDDETPPPGSSESSETDMEEDDGIAEGQFEEPNSKISGEDNLCSGLLIEEIEVQDINKLACWMQADQEETGSESCIESDASKEIEIIREKGMDEDESVSDAIDMDWEEEEAPYFDNVIDYSMFSDDGSVTITSHLPGNEDPHELACDEDDSVITDEEAPDETLVLEVYEEDAESFTTLFGVDEYEGNNVELDDGEENLEFCEASNASHGLNHNQPSVVEPELPGHYDESIFPDAKKSDGLSDTKNGIIYCTGFMASAEDVVGDPTEADGDNKMNPEQENDFLNEHASFEDDTKCDLRTTEMISLEYEPETDQGAVTENHSSGHQHPDTDSESPELNEIDNRGVLEGQTFEISETEHLVIASNFSQEQVLQSTDVGDAAERKVDEDSNDLLEIQISKSSETGQDTDNADHTAEYVYMETEVCQCDDGVTQENRCSQEAAIDPKSITPDQCIRPATQCTVYDQPDMHNEDDDQVSEQGKVEYHYFSKSTSFEECDDTERYGSSSAEDCIEVDHKMQSEEKTMMSSEETCVAANIKSPEYAETIINAGTESNQPETYSNLKGKTKRVGKRPIENCEQLKTFNPRAPRFLVPEPDPEAEKVNLRHQMIDEKNAEEWMIDYALQQAVTKLAPTRKRRVSLLVEAFETVMPSPKYEPHLRHAAASFTHARPIQACS